MKNVKLYIFDFEVFKQDWFVSFLDIDSNTFTTFRNDSLKLMDFIENNKNDAIFIGYNNKWFDNWCLKCIYYEINPYRIVHHSIVEGKEPWTLPELAYKKNISNFQSIDLMNGINSNISLKEIEGNLGMKIQESNIDFDVSYKLSDEQYKECLEYNKHDCLATKELYLILENEQKFLSSKRIICDEYKIPYSNLCKTWPGILAIVTDCKKVNQEQYLKYKHPDCIKLLNDTPIKKYEENLFAWDKNDKFSFKYNIQDVECTLALGGIHGAKENYIKDITKDRICVLLDWDNLYLNLMLNDVNPEFQFYSKAMTYPEELKKIKQKRKEYKDKGNEVYSAAFKQALVPAYGSMLMETNPFFDWVQGRRVCITGQLAFCMLGEYICRCKSAEIFNINTDGVFLMLNADELDELKKHIAELTQKINLNFKFDIITSGKIIQKNVNMYIIYDKLRNKIKAKGKEYNKYNGGNYKNNSLSIIDEAVVNYFLYQKPINYTIIEAYQKNEWIKFQMIYNRKGKNYTNTYWGDKVMQKCNRVFATNDLLPTLTKMKNNTKHKFANVPDRCFIWNEDLSTLTKDKVNLNTDWYINLAKKKVEEVMS